MQSRSNPAQRKAIEPESPTGHLHEAIARRAREIYEKSGRLPGRDLQNWTQAEAEILRENNHHPARKSAIMVRVNGVEYIGEYSTASAGGYTPSELSQAEPVSVRFEGERMYIKRPNGQELETRLVRRVG